MEIDYLNFQAYFPILEQYFVISLIPMKVFIL